MTKRQNIKEPNYYSGESAISDYANIDHTDNYLIGKGSVNDRTFISVDSNVSVRSAYDRRDYDYYRQAESNPKDVVSRINLCLRLYEDNGILHNVVDLMADFASQGIRFQHPSSAINRFYKTFYDKVNVKERSERFINYLLKGGNVVVKKDYAKINVKTERDFKQFAAEDIQIIKDTVVRKEIPIRYTFFLPNDIEVIGGELANFIGKPIYAIKLPSHTSSAISSMFNIKDDEYIKFLNEQLSNDIKDKIKKGEKYIVPDQNKISVFHYKKDDNAAWAKPLASPIMSDLIQLEKYKLADNSALDGAISNIRLWTMGIIGESPQSSILPKKAMFDKLRSILANNVGGGVMDLVWGPELKFQESNSQVWRWLGSDKYGPVWNAIYDGLGLPPSMRTAGSSSSGTGNYVGLNTLIKRLQYVRDILVAFWKAELSYIHDAMNFPGRPPEIIFDFMVFADEAAEKQLWINLWDRNIVPTETIQEVFGRYPGFENSRIVKEHKAMESGKYPDKASPFHNAEKEHDLKKIMLQAGDVTASEVGVELEPRKAGEKTRIDVQSEDMMKKAKLDAKTKVEMGHPPAPVVVGGPKNVKPKGTAGRPKNTTETKKRKPKPKGRASTKAAVMTWTKSAYQDISELLMPVLLKQLGKSNARKLTEEEAESIELIKFGVLCDIEPLSQVTAETVFGAISNPSGKEKTFRTEIAETKQTFSLLNKKESTQDELRNIYTNIYSLYLIEEMDNQINSQIDNIGKSTDE